MTRLTLGCGHVAFSLPSEARQVARQFFWCFACSRFERIEHAEPLEQAPRPPARLRRHVTRKRTSPS